MPDINQDKVVKHYNKRASTYTDMVKKTFPMSAVKTSEKKAVRSLLKNIEGSEILEVGCGTGFHTETLLEMNAGKIFAVDISPEMLKGLPASDKIVPICAKAEDLNLDKKFNAVLNSGATEFVPDALKLFEVLRNHSNTGAYLYLHITNGNFLGFLLSMYYKMRGISFNTFSDKKIEEYAKKTGWQIDAKTNGMFNWALIYRLKAV